MKARVTDRKIVLTCFREAPSFASLKEKTGGEAMIKTVIQFTFTLFPPVRLYLLLSCWHTYN